MSATPPHKVLILCTGNSARSIIGEYLLRSLGRGRFDAFSAGAKPTGRVNPLALWVLRDRYGLDASDACSKSWDEFHGTEFEFVITVCDHAREVCPVWPGHPVVAHWGSPDPAAVEGSEETKRRAFVAVASQLHQRISLFCALPEDQLDALRVGRIGEQYRLDANAPSAPASPSPAAP